VGPHGGQLIEDRNNQFEVTFDKEARQVSVYALRMGVGPPENMRLRLYISPDKTETVELHAVPNATDPTPMYQGKLTVAADSYLAAGVTFNVSIFG
jgi:hypothetical protein